jgi:hypothetical protein
MKSWPDRRRQEQCRDRRRIQPQRTHGQAPCRQHPAEARPAVTGGGGGFRGHVRLARTGHRDHGAVRAKRCHAAGSAISFPCRQAEMSPENAANGGGNAKSNGHAHHRWRWPQVSPRCSPSNAVAEDSVGCGNLQGHRSDARLGAGLLQGVSGRRAFQAPGPRSRAYSSIPRPSLNGKTKEVGRPGRRCPDSVPVLHLFPHRGGQANGATDEEIREAVAMAAVVRHWSTMLNGMQVDLTTVQEADRRRDGRRQGEVAIASRFRSGTTTNTGPPEGRPTGG